jgi:hypothetical protein
MPCVCVKQVTLTGQGDNTDHNAVGAAVNTISTNLPDMAREVKMLAALMDDRGTEGDDLMGAARTLCGAFSDMLRAAEPQTNEVRRPEVMLCTEYPYSPALPHTNQGCGSGSGSGSVFNRVCGSGSVFGIRIRIRIQEGKNDPQK